MAGGNQMIGGGDDGSLTSNLAGMSKNQLYDIMSQMKTLIEQNQKQARQVLVDNPALTKALFQAQIMLGMVQSPQAMPNIQKAPSQPPQQSSQPGRQQGIQAHSSPVQVGIQEQANASQTQVPARKQQPNQPLPAMPSASVPPVTIQAKTLPSHSVQSQLHPKGHLNTQGTSMSLPPPSQIHNIPQLHSGTQPPSLHPHGPAVSQSQPSPHPSGSQHLPPQPPFQPQPRPPLMQQPFQHQSHPQMGPHMGFPSSGVSHPHHSQPPFSSGTKLPGNIGSSFPHGQPPLPSQPPPQSLYQGGGAHIGSDFNNHGGNAMQVDRASWMPGPPENVMGGTQLPGPPPQLPAHMGPTSQPPLPPPQLSPEFEHVILQQVMSLTPEQINLLPQDQRKQVFQLQQMFRQGRPS